MKSDTEIRLEGMRALMAAMGPAETERFITLLLREPFDYTEWRQDLCENMNIAEISAAAMAQQRRRATE